MKSILLIFTLSWSVVIGARAQIQIKDTILAHTHTHKKFYQTRVFKSSIAPVVLIGYGISTVHDRGLPSSHWIYQEVHEHLNIKRSHIDDYLQYLPYAGLVGLNLFHVKSENDLLNTGLLTVKSVGLTAVMVFTIKELTNITRPDSANPAERNSFPSGHTANAFAAATLVHKEFGKTNGWYSVAAYSVATTVGAFRILNNRHWFSDVLAGAGFGILSVNVVYLTHQYRWGHKRGLVIAPTYFQRGVGFCMVKSF